MALFSPIKPTDAAASSAASSRTGIPIAGLFAAIRARDPDAEIKPERNEFVTIVSREFARGCINLYGVRDGLATSLQLRTWMGDDRVLTEKLNLANRFNREHRFLKVYVDADGDFAVEIDDLPDRGDPVGTVMALIDSTWRNGMIGFMLFKHAA